MTNSEFDALLTRLHPPVRAVLESIASSSRLMVCLTVAQRLWIDQRPEDADTAEFRHQLKHLERCGHFDFTDWHTDPPSDEV